jgi:hypothetical protein
MWRKDIVAITTNCMYSNRQDARTEVIVAVLMMIAIFKDMTPCCLGLP